MHLLQVGRAAEAHVELFSIARVTQHVQGAVALKESVAYGRLLLQSLFSQDKSTPHIARYAVLLANSLGADPVLSADALGVTHLVDRAGGSSEMLHAISGLVAEAACTHCIQAAAEANRISSSTHQAGASNAAAADFRNRDATVEQLLSAAVAIAGSGSRGVVDHDAASGIAMLSLAVRVSRFVGLHIIRFVSSRQSCRSGFHPLCDVASPHFAEWTQGATRRSPSLKGAGTF